MDCERLVAAALEARKNAYAPYSGFAVGAALLSTDGRIFLGCNLENAAYPAGICAERAALAAAVCAGARRFTAIAVAAETPPAPCGICRQTLSEFGDMHVICADCSGGRREFALSALLPEAFEFSEKGGAR